jgi:6,7-dimethyl-8-ribityllumazine synthase
VSTIDSPERAPAHLDGPAPRLLIIQAPYYAEVVGGMRQGAEAVLAEIGAHVDVADVAGAYELPAALRMALRRQLWDGFLLLGCVVRGETDHYTFICDAVCQGVMAITAETGAPLGFGLLTVDTLDQAIARSRADRMNKGAEAAHALVGQLKLAREWATKSAAQAGGRR